jgi:hypothetical protein
MVMRNRHDGANAPQWWDDLPPEIKKRCANTPHLKNQDASQRDCDQEDFWRDSPIPSAVRVRRDLSRLALIFVILAFANLVFLLLAKTILHGPGLFNG